MANYGDLLFIEHVERLPMSDCESMPAEVRDRLRSIPAVHELLAEWPVMKPAGHAGATMVREAVAAELDAERAAIRSGAPARNKRELALAIERRTHRLSLPTLRPAVNATGVVIHTNLGRAPLAPAAVQSVTDVARSYSTLEYDVATCARGGRKEHAARLLRTLTGSQDALVVNNNAAAVLLEYPDILGVVLPEILPCVGFDQRNPHHCYDVWGHTARAVGAAPPTRVLRWTMLLHDLGKPKCFTQDANGIGHFYGHTAASAEMAEEIMARLRFEHTLAQGVRAQLACFDEMFPPERAAVHRMMARYGRETMWNLLQTKLADNAAKAPDGLERAQKPWREALLLYNEMLAENACCSLAELRIGGGELLEIGFSGRAVGRAKQRLLDEVASERLANEHGALVRRAERLYRSGWRGETDGRE